MKYISKVYVTLGFIIFFLLVLGDVAVSKNPLFGRIATVLWFVSFGYVTIFAIKCLIDIITHLAGFKTVFTVLLLLIWFVILAINISQTKNISGETTQEINCILNHLSTLADWGYGKPCFLGCPSKQYLLMALPTLLFGRSLISLNSGVAFIFLLGIIIFSGGLLRFFQYKRYGDFISAILLGSIFHFYYVNHFLFYFEQSILPFCFGLIITGFFLYYFTEKKALQLTLIGFLLLYLIFSYTPSLSLYFLAICVLVYLLFDRKISKRQKLLLLLVIVLTLISCYFSMKYRDDIKLVSLKDHNQTQIIDDLQQTLGHLLSQNKGHPIVSPVYNFIFIAFIVISSLFTFGWRYAFFSHWMIGVIILSVISKGYAYYGIDFRLHRASVIIPVFLAMLAFLSKRFYLEDKGKYLFGILIVILFTGVYFQKTILDTKDPNKHYLFIDWISKNQMFVREVKQKKNLFFFSDAFRDYISINDELQYFIPQLTKSQYSPKDCRIDAETRGIFVIKMDDPCFLSLTNSGLVNYSIYRYKDDSLVVFEAVLKRSSK